ncbi:hypothetical protein ONE63_007913 [Megalurothrips usitatus]|uniref:Baculoviral IAP repeat-containing protein 5 n=1 Tax=Megalurothrips usitatus TaxID=439358 RepID=A0AAV7XW38_9NEOP|nr:hypothetical protein ONE63_007913 [Megalurothrips usitatus]
MQAYDEWASSPEERLKSFKHWPFKQGPCSPDKMAEAGFYAIGKKSEPDLAKCYVCFKELDGWERDDDPWLEHEKHAAQCPFVLLKKKPSELTAKEILTLEVERSKKFMVLQYDIKFKLLQDLKESVLEELEKTGKGGKENRKRKTSRATAKRPSRKD